MQLEFGKNGTLIESETVTGDFSVISALENAVLNVEVNWIGSASPQSLTMVAGQNVYGVFTSVEVTSGKVVAYR